MTGGLSNVVVNAKFDKKQSGRTVREKIWWGQTQERRELKNKEWFSIRGKSNTVIAKTKIRVKKGPSLLTF